MQKDLQKSVQKNGTNAEGKENGSNAETGADAFEESDAEVVQNFVQ